MVGVIIAATRWPRRPLWPGGVLRAAVREASHSAMLHWCRGSCIWRCQGAAPMPAVQMLLCARQVSTVTDRSLVMLDELGQGTEAKHAAAMAGAILAQLDASVRLHAALCNSRASCGPARPRNASLAGAALASARRNSLRCGRAAAASSRPTCTRCWTLGWAWPATCPLRCGAQQRHLPPIRIAPAAPSREKHAVASCCSPLEACVRSTSGWGSSQADGVEWSPAGRCWMAGARSGGRYCAPESGFACPATAVCCAGCLRRCPARSPPRRSRRSCPAAAVRPYAPWRAMRGGDGDGAPPPAWLLRWQVHGLAGIRGGRGLRHAA